MFMTHTKEIEGITFQVKPFPAVTALRLKMRLLKNLAPAFGQLMGSMNGIGNGKISEVEIDGKEFSAALRQLFEVLDEAEFINLLKALFEEVSCEISDGNGKSVLVSFDKSNFDFAMNTVFQGKLFSIYPLILFVLEVNFPDFFGKIGNIGSRLSTLLSKEGVKNEKNLDEKLAK